jgi:predicted ferric reductase
MQTVQATMLNCYEPSKVIIMESILYIIAVILVIGWLIGFVGYQAGGLIHILLVIAVVAVLLRLIRGRTD